MIISISHDCPYCGPGHKNKCFAEYSDGFKCFSCGSSSFKEQFFKKNMPIDKGAFELNYTRDINKFTNRNLKYLFDCCLTVSDIVKNNILQSEDSSLVFPVISNNKIVFYYSKNLETGLCKSRGKKRPLLRGEGDKLVICEDWLSGCRLSKHCSSLTLFGLNLNYEKICEIVEVYKTVHIWLDSDQPGVDAAKKLMKWLTIAKNKLEERRTLLLNSRIIIKNIKTLRDPKNINDSHMKNILKYGGNL